MTADTHHVNAGRPDTRMQRRRRVLPPRDARGRFVAHPTTAAPSWYVFDAAGYRIVGDSELLAPVPLPAAPRVPRRVTRRAMPTSRPSLIASRDVRFLISMTIFLAILFAYALQLPRPHHRDGGLQLLLR
jgi:hypothetical protein